MNLCYRYGNDSDYRVHCECGTVSSCWRAACFLPYISTRRIGRHLRSDEMHLGDEKLEWLLENSR